MLSTEVVTSLNQNEEVKKCRAQIIKLILFWPFMLLSFSYIPSGIYLRNLIYALQQQNIYLRSLIYALRQQNIYLRNLIYALQQQN
jgi:hypothetical protein